MPLSSLGLASDVMVLGDTAHFEEHPDRFILRSPSEPTFWFGNMVIFRDDIVAPEAQIAQFQQDFPKARHVTLAWDVIDMGRPERLAPFAEMGFKLDSTDVLVLSGPLQNHAPPPGIELRPLRTDADWLQATALQGVTGIEQGNKPQNYLPFIKTRMQTCRRLCDSGLGVWLGAFAQDQLVGDLGIFANAQTARFQAVETRADHRRQGICAALVTAGVEWALARYPGTRPVIIAERDEAPGRVYRRCGFVVKERLRAVYRGPTDSDECP